MTLSRFACSTGLLSAALMLCGLAQPSASPVPKTDLAGVPVPRLAERLAGLSPDQPEAYFELAEDLSAEAAVPAARGLARHLLVLAFTTDAARSGPRAGELGPSVCIALASLSSSESDRRWLRGLGMQLSQARAQRTVAIAPAKPGPQARAAKLRGASGSLAAGLDLANALGFIRAGNGRAAATLLNRPGVPEVIAAHGGLLSVDGGPLDAGKRLADLAEQSGPCRECHNRRFVLRPDVASPSRTPRPRVCPVCGGSPGPRLSDDELLAQLRLESAALRGIQQSWSGQILSDSAAPLRDPDPAELPVTFRVDPTLSVFRNGQWQKP